MFNRFSKIVLILSIFIGSFFVLPNLANAAAAEISFDLNPKTVADTSKLQADFQMRLRVTINIDEFNSECGRDANSFASFVYWDTTGPDVKKYYRTTQINRTQPTQSFTLDERIRVNLDPSEFLGGSSNYYGAVSCSDAWVYNLTESTRIPITFGSATDKNWACVAGDNKYACSTLNLSNCSDVPACAGRSCIEIGKNLCGLDAGTGPLPPPGGGGGGGTGSGCDTPGQPACRPGASQSYDFEITNPLKGGADDFSELVKIIAQWIFNLAIPIAVAMIVYAGILFLTAAGEPAKVTKAKDVLKYAVIGLAIILIGSGFVTLIQSILDLGAPPNSNQQVFPTEDNTEGTTTAVGAIGNICSRNRDCLSGLECQDSICKRETGNWIGEPCNAGRNCDIGLSCDKSGSAIQPIDGQTLGTCYDSGNLPGGRIGDACQRDNECLSGLECNQICQRRDGNLNGEACVRTASPSNCESRACHTIGAEVRGDCVPYSGT